MTDLQTIGIVGGAGRMSRVYIPELAVAGYKVKTSEKPSKMKELENLYKLMGVGVCQSNRELIENSDMVIYATPATTTPQIIRMTARYAKPNTILSDIRSVKKEVMKAYRVVKGGREKDYEEKNGEAGNKNPVVSLHPLHGPTIGPQKQKMLIVPARTRNNEVKEVEEIFSKQLDMNTKVLNNWREHDKLLADPQGVTHIVGLSMLRAWQRSGVNPLEEPMYQNPISRLKYLMSARMFTSSAQTYAIIAIENDYVKPQVEMYSLWLDRFMDYVQDHDLDGLKDIFKNPLRHLNDSLDNGRKIFDRLVENLYGPKEFYDINKQTNSEVSQLVTPLVWADMEIDPSKNEIFNTPPYTVRWITALRALSDHFEKLLKNSIENKETRRQDYYFVRSFTEWETLVASKNVTGFVNLFNRIVPYYKEYLPYVIKESNRVVENLPECVNCPPEQETISIG